MKAPARAKQIDHNVGQRASVSSWTKALSFKPTKLVVGALAIVLAAGFSYRVRELLAALLIFSVAFLALAFVLFILSALDETAYRAVVYVYQQVFHFRRKSSISLAR